MIPGSWRMRGPMSWIDTESKRLHSSRACRATGTPSSPQSPAIPSDSPDTAWGIRPGRPRGVAFVHCGVLSVGVRKALGLPSPFDMKFSNPVDLHAVALRFPQLRFVVPHFGAGYLRE